MSQPVEGKAEQPRTIALVRDLARQSVRFQHISARRSGLSNADLATISLLKRGTVGPAELARLLDVTTAAVTGITDRLAARGYVERHPIPGDRRRTALHLTELGEADFEENLKGLVTALAGIEAQFTSEEIDVVSRYLTAAINVMEDEAERVRGL